MGIRQGLRLVFPNGKTYKTGKQMLLAQEQQLTLKEKWALLDQSQFCT